MDAPSAQAAAPRRSRAALEAAALAVVVGAVALGVLLALTPSSPAASPAASPSSSGAGLRWSLHGARTTLAGFRGHPVLLTFLDSRCTNLCPIEGAQLAQVQQRLAAAARPQLVVVSVNPADTPASVARFVREAGWPGRWTWLLGSRAELRPVWDEYHIGVQMSHGRAVQTGNTTIRVGGGVAHTIALYLIDSRGREQAGFLPPFRPAAVAREVRALDR